MTERMSNLSAI